ncbi:tRNA dimethylallyltransferase [Gammaproteobacteria bacterium SCGC AG-212-F23]|nr:tRNA dimethylallyltransferase [Gammaproteobacteria bacterium SCGC AG-212-F23]
MNITPQLAICLMGPTASGKTQLAVELVQKYPLEIISVDSAMVYRGMDIGTAKPSADILKIAPHHLLNIRDPLDAYSAAQFCEDATRVMQEIIARKKIPFLVGGTMLYFRALQQGLAVMPASNTELREKLFAEGEQKSWPVMHAHLVDIDPAAAKRIHPHDRQRIQRALEVYALTGKTISTLHDDATKNATTFSYINFAMTTPEDRSLLHARIAERFSQMLAQGLIDEVKKLFERGDLSIDTPAIRSVGYRQVWLYLQGKLSYDEMCAKAIIATRQLAKRQLTWLRSWPGLTWISAEEKSQLTDLFDTG